MAGREQGVAGPWLRYNSRGLRPGGGRFQPRRSEFGADDVGEVGPADRLADRSTGRVEQRSAAPDEVEQAPQGVGRPYGDARYQRRLPRVARRYHDPADPAPDGGQQPGQYPPYRTDPAVEPQPAVH